MCENARKTAQIQAVWEEGIGPSVHNVPDKNMIIPATGTHIPDFFIGTFDFSKALFYNEIKGGRMT